MAKRSSKTSKKLIAVELGAGVVAAAAAAAAAYFFSSKKSRRRVRSWMLKAKAEVLEKMEKLKEINDQVYRDIVDSVMKKYQVVKSVDPKELEQFAQDLKSHWKNIQRELKAIHTKAKTAKKCTSSKAKASRRKER